MTDPDLAGWRRLGCAILLLAYKDAREGNGHSQDARQFLAGDGARRLVAWLDLDAAGLAVALGDLPAPTWEQLTLPLGGPPAIGAAGPHLAGVTPAAPAPGQGLGCVTGQLARDTRRRRAGPAWVGA